MHVEVLKIGQLEPPTTGKTQARAVIARSIAMAGENEEYDLLEDVGEEVDYDDFTLEDEDLGK